MRDARGAVEDLEPRRIGLRRGDPPPARLAEALAAGIGVGILPCFIGDRMPGLARLGSVNPEELGESLWILTHTDLRNAARVRALDLRCGLALIIAGMCASGETEIADFHHAERGYEDLAGRLTSLGAVLRIDGS